MLNYLHGIPGNIKIIIRQENKAGFAAVNSVNLPAFSQEDEAKVSGYGTA